MEQVKRVLVTGGSGLVGMGIKEVNAFVHITGNIDLAPAGDH